MAKAIKYVNGTYLDSSNVNYKKNNLKSIVDSILSNPIGEFVLWEGEKEVIENGNWQFLAMHYSLKEAINTKFPIKMVIIESLNCVWSQQTILELLMVINMLGFHKIHILGNIFSLIHGEISLAELRPFNLWILIIIIYLMVI